MTEQLVRMPGALGKLSAPMKNHKSRILVIALVLQSLAIIFFSWDVVLDLAEVRHSALGADAFHSLVELVAVISLMLAFVVTLQELRDLLRRMTLTRAQLQMARSGLMDILEAQFGAWNLTAAERDVALLTIKGMAIPEIAASRSTRPGTVKAQLNAIYGKAGVAGRHELLSMLIEELLFDNDEAAA